MLEGVCYRATAGGVVTSPPDDARVPFAVVTHFRPDLSLATGQGTLADLTTALDASRPSENLFVGLRVDGHFERLSLRAACAAASGENLLEATAHQSEFTIVQEVGTLVGFWAPLYARAVNVPGYHFHFISEDRHVGGHLLDMDADRPRGPSCTSRPSCTSPSPKPRSSSPPISVATTKKPSTKRRRRTTDQGRTNRDELRGQPARSSSCRKWCRSRGGLADRSLRRWYGWDRRPHAAKNPNAGRFFDSSIARSWSSMLVQIETMCTTPSPWER